MSGLDRSAIEEIVRDILGRYNLLQFAGQGALQVFSAGSMPLHALNYGMAVVHWPGALQKSDPVTVSHGLPGIPAVVIAQIAWPSTNEASTIPAESRVWNVTSSTFDMEFTDPLSSPPAQSATAFWLAGI